MSTVKTTAMSAFSTSIAIILIALGMFDESYGAQNPVDRAVEFLTNAYSGQIMQPEEWLTKEARNAPMFKGFGGLDALVKQSTARAHKFGGLKTVTVRDVKKEGNTYKVVIEIAFMQDHIDPSNSAMATQEDMIWNIQIIKQGGSWKLTW